MVRKIVFTVSESHIFSFHRRKRDNGLILILRSDDVIDIDKDVSGDIFAIVRIVGVTCVRIIDEKVVEVIVEYDAKGLCALNVANVIFYSAKIED